MVRDNRISKGLKTARIIQIAYLVAILIYADLMFHLLLGEGISPVLSIGDSRITILTVVLSVLAACSIVTGYFWPQLVKGDKSRMGLLSVYVVRAALLGSVAGFGLILGLVGAVWGIPLIFFLVSAVALILTFPTREKWKKMMEYVGLDF